jgi:hypothetical protein
MSEVRGSVLVPNARARALLERWERRSMSRDMAIDGTVLYAPPIHFGGANREALRHS